MKYYVLIIMIGVIGAPLWSADPPPPSHDDPVKKVTLEDAKNFAIQHNQEVGAAQNALEEARAAVGKSRSSFFPNVGIAAGADTQISSGNSEGTPIGYLYGNYNLFNGFVSTYESKVASLEAEKAEVRLRRTKFRVGLEVEEAFHQFLFKKNTAALKKKSIEANEKHRKMAGQKRRAGMASDSDMMEFDLKDALLRSDLLLVEQELEETRTELRRLLGEEIGSKIEPIGELQHQHLTGSLMDYVKKIKSESEDVLIASKDLAISSYQSKKEGAGWLPKVNIEVAAGYLPWDLRTVDGGTAMIGGKIEARFNLFSGFETMYAQREARLRQMRRENELRSSILKAITATENAYRRIAVIQARVDLEEKNGELAQKYYDSVLSEYRRGVKNSSDLRVAAELVYEAALKREAFKYEFLSHRIELERASGVPVPTETVKDKGV